MSFSSPNKTKFRPDLSLLIETVGDPDPDLFELILDPIDSSVADPGFGAFFTFGSGMEKNTDLGYINIPDHSSKSLLTIFSIKNA